MNNMDVSDAKDCFAYKNKKCTILKLNKCEGIDCGFFKTKEEFKLGQKKAIERILSLDKDKRDYIIETYYGGKIEVV
ncbi:hypothetical protein [Paramaledivibacter caminithermalis]|jgi:hypothetical protein|uniref:Uncharacterized protein n=1 Tax=Paramaledivibacter caminithermalis (strain DSM 15212 / CIP 107654 / DViRD3) TaxID=1121301 RepID=A0A1M6M297_PARC5|nr:hypothetical protein [Paramaledivibacter caminithermalis]SHJ77575.1 hypothetical protein SAMN02745912_01044 [Paramaledivibacter caminithermalis DSM 15212]